MFSPNDASDPSMDIPECEHEHCETCGECHVFECHAWRVAGEYCPLVCVSCEQPIEVGAPRDLNTYPWPSGYMHLACFERFYKQVEADIEQEREAETRNEEALYGYELPRERRMSDRARADYEYQYTRHDHLCQCQGCSGDGDL